MKTPKNVHGALLGMVCLLNALTSCKKQDTINLQNGSVINNSEKSTTSVTSTIGAPSSNVNFSNALSQCKLQSSYENSGTSTTDYNTNGLVKSDYFYLSSTNKMVLISPLGASERTELRQNADMSLNTSQRMRFDAVIENIPSGSGVTIAQVHNDYSAVEKPLIRVYISGTSSTSKTITSKMSNTYEKDDTSYTSGSGSVSFSNGQRVYVRLQFQTSGKKIAVYVENKDNGQVYSQTYTVPSAWNNADGNYYFKTGAYNQGSDQKAKLSYNSLYIDQP
ncbi:polysaccharide lyase family 7 protein [Desertivirga xinjiangensis]|uniref:polysaccharide lyase family 7 protein n=1 Tax=Desertivirga xinjiangensis TaxID=539206 RepID=UPI002108E04C|nr:polysaccharide lyase family 7 protein [Pedobacter xinjiangensis]